MDKQPNVSHPKRIGPQQLPIDKSRKGFRGKDLYIEILKNPAQSFFTKSLPDQKGKRVVEISCFLAAYSLSETCSNAERYINISRLQSVSSSHKSSKPNDLLSRDHVPIDTVIFNATSSAQNDDASPGRSLKVLNKALDTYLPEVRTWLGDAGTIILCFSERLKLDKLHDKFIKNKLFLSKKTQLDSQGTTHYLYELKPINFKNPVQTFIYEDDHLWFKKYQPFLKSSSVLKVGNGLGFSSYFMSLFQTEVTSLDVVLNTDALSDDVVLYEGSRIPFDDNSFDTVVCTYTLHHTPSPEALFAELCRVSKRTIIVIDETYKSFWQKLDLVYTCWQTNRRGGQKVQIQWASYLSENRFAQLFSDQGLQVQTREQAPRKSFKVDLIVGTK